LKELKSRVFEMYGPSLLV